jgi:hypothetical protein
MAATRLRLVRLVTLTSAGLATFYGAAQWSRAAKDGPLAEAIVQTAAAAPVGRASVVVAAVAAPSASTPGAIEGPKPRPPLTSEGRAFARLSWLPPPPPPAPPPPAAPPPAQAPTAPPLPYTFVGMVEQGVGKPQAFLSRGDALIIVAAGDVIDSNTYRVESLSSSQVVLIYLPLDTRQVIDIAGASK